MRKTGVNNGPTLRQLGGDEDTYSLPDEVGLRAPGEGFGGLSGLAQFGDTAIGKAVITTIGAIAGDPGLGGQIQQGNTTLNRLGITGPGGVMPVHPPTGWSTNPSGDLVMPPPPPLKVVPHKLTRTQAIESARKLAARFATPDARAAAFLRLLRIALRYVH